MFTGVFRSPVFFFLREIACIKCIKYYTGQKMYSFKQKALISGNPKHESRWKACYKCKIMQMPKDQKKIIMINYMWPNITDDCLIKEKQ